MTQKRKEVLDGLARLYAMSRPDDPLALAQAATVAARILDEKPAVPVHMVKYSFNNMLWRETATPDQIEAVSALSGRQLAAAKARMVANSQKAAARKLASSPDVATAFGDTAKDLRQFAKGIAPKLHQLAEAIGDLPLADAGKAELLIAETEALRTALASAVMKLKSQGAKK